MRETKYTQAVLCIVHAAMEIFGVSHNSVISMVLVVIQLVILIINYIYIAVYDYFLINNNGIF